VLLPVNPGRRVTFKGSGAAGLMRNRSSWLVEMDASQSFLMLRRSVVQCVKKK
jgi:hypothetical protein